MMTNAGNRADLDRWLVSDVKPRFMGRIVGLDSDAADIWGRIAAEARKRGQVVSTPDAMIAAIALRHNLSIVTRNEVDFIPTGAPTVNPWN